ncbi:UDP-galactose transporter senju-like [Saccostrea echinata]|uniref:UDP-galactose transporter senju-like n=1 Tax=Saccostrea echinata TaxID=191078 RepID=UPI002A7FC0A3|nr:UDP-galactose transporter senju-like [Saccostrea echinata]XP_061183506.1 UDP-galactose transporter senju-like [Saccostrea echinata]
MGLFSGDLFPTKMSFIIFISYMGLFINQGILVTASKNKNNTYSYNTVTVVLLTELLKLVVSSTVYLKDNPVSSYFSEIYKHRSVLMYYFVPAALYCLYNNLQFVNLATYDPTTYYLLLQFRVVVTGVVFQVIFSKKLSRYQWVSLTFLTLGCIVKEYGHDSKSSLATSASSTSSPLSVYFNHHLLLILVQVFSSCFAGVYNEYLLKDKGVDVHIMLQNVFMYLDSIFCNALVLGFKGEFISALEPGNIAAIMQPGVLIIVVNNAAIGIVTSLFLRNLNSILKTFASALELMFTAVLCWIIFGIAIDIYTIVAIFIVSAATVMYAQKPVVNLAKTDIEIQVDPPKESV